MDKRQRVWRAIGQRRSRGRDLRIKR